MRHSRLAAGVVQVLLLGLCRLAGAADAPSAVQRQVDPAAGYPNRAVRLVVPFAPGGGADVIARLLAQKVGAAWNQPVVIDNRGGGGSVIGTNTVAKALPDGYTLLLQGVSVAYLPALYNTLPYDTEKELLPVVLAVTQPSAIVVNPSIQAATLAEFIALAKSRPAQIRYGSGGSGSASHLAAELFRVTAKINLVHVPYKGGGPAVISLLAGETQALITSMVTVLPHIKSGRMRALAVTGQARTKVMPDLPTVGEAGVPGAEFDGWFGLLATVGTPASVVGKLNADINRALAADDVRERFAEAGYDMLGGTQEKFAAHLKAEIKKWTTVVRAANIKVD